MVAICTRSTFCRALITSTSILLPSSKEYEADPFEQERLQSAYFVRNQVTNIIKNQDSTLAGSILRLAFHDATVRSISAHPEIGGMDGSIRYELDWSENRGLSKPLKVVQQVYEDALYASLERKELSVGVNVITTGQDVSSLSFADVLALSGAAAVEATNGPIIKVKLGRKDVDHADNRFLDEEIISESDRSNIKTSLPSPGLDSLGLRNYFKRLGLSEAEFVALSGAHDLGRHVTLLNMPKQCLKNLTRTCLEEAPISLPFVFEDPDTFSNSYFAALLRWNYRIAKRGEAMFLPTDVAMVVDEGLRKYVAAYSRDENLFFRRFTTAYQKLVDNTATTQRRY
uniref:Plant heme peroxidase family profile domain-containing protein n=1 Tax=Chaetoceros debilis TaxID=122233 RepID=A0A6S8S1W6_9STRA|mmetsp:Transcript_16254/g.24389  ORF Transcript_16254/g.24389 Transcript_16254/m.24389 type:complete len:342 (+) Transcript_16254:784-1809(+)|eukprot:CAMPEP_0194094960 /NCGR_PEP_ID=MMETSP0149-20130528/56176_1 /TAXON_ID=122233 /ORGANISM="Chaetoceros debilis, Strain MM31A-1" /LENGTH=341 /DNA_ID=CAMNT_0038780857 /DNA_START=392 /DNA_END=1417 /DNA_ORIENTATION=-